jgi:glycosyltransferase involved in cell wall biosynthesis
MPDITATKPKILFGFTLNRSLDLMKGLPELLVAEGWEVHIVSSPGVSLEAYGRLAGVTTHALSMTRKPNLLKDGRSFTAWLKILRKIRPDVVSIGTPKAGLLGITASFIARVPQRIYHLRGLRLETLSGLPRWAMWLLERWVILAATEVLSISPSLRKAAIEMKLVAAPKIHVVANGSSNGVDLMRFGSSKQLDERASSLAGNLQLDPELPVLGFVGRLNLDKGLDLLIEASKALNRENVAHQLLVVGSNEDATLVNLLRQHNRCVPVTLIDRVEDIVPYYRLMTCLVFPTRREGFGNVSVEAQASGIPVITTSSTGAIDTVEDYISGLIVPRNDAVALKRAIKDVLVGRVCFKPSKIRQSVKRFDRTLVHKELVSYYSQFANT